MLFTISYFIIIGCLVYPKSIIHLFIYRQWCAHHNIPPNFYHIISKQSRSMETHAEMGISKGPKTIDVTATVIEERRNLAIDIMLYLCIW